MSFMVTLGALLAKCARKVSKSIRFAVKVEGVLRLCKTSKTIGKQRFGAGKKDDQNTLFITLVIY